MSWILSIVHYPVHCSPALLLTQVFLHMRSWVMDEKLIIIFAQKGWLSKRLNRLGLLSHFVQCGIFTPRRKQTRQVTWIFSVMCLGFAWHINPISHFSQLSSRIFRSNIVHYDQMNINPSIQLIDPTDYFRGVLCYVVKCVVYNGRMVT
jgi:hypothetical protein